MPSVKLGPNGLPIYDPGAGYNFGSPLAAPPGLTPPTTPGGGTSGGNNTIILPGGSAPSTTPGGTPPSTTSAPPPVGTPTGGSGLGPGGMPNVTNSPDPGRQTAVPAGNLFAPSLSAQIPGNWSNPWLPSVTAGMNGSPVSFASPGSPNPNYATSGAAGDLAKAFGADLVTQNLTNMASPGSPAPSAPMMGLDFGRGDVQGADVGLTGLARGDSPESIAARYQAGLNTKAWAGDIPVPVTNPMDNTFWNRTTPVANNTMNPTQAAFFAPQPTAPYRPPPQVNIPPGGIGGFFT